MNIYVVEDDPFFRKLLEHNLKLIPEYKIKTFKNATDFLNCLDEAPDIVTLDYALPDVMGDKVLKKIKDYNPNINVIMISGQEDISTAVSLLKEGAYDYISKDENIKDRLLKTIHNISIQEGLKSEITNLKKEISQKYDYSKVIIGNSNPIKDIFFLIEKAININNITVSITGETGTGKELVAKTIHYNSQRKNNSFVAVNMGAIPKELIESELFGHEKGAFTGAYFKKKGKFEEAQGGTIFLDEIAELDFNLQVKLLRVLQEKEIVKVGGNTPVKIDVRIITATNKDLAQEVKKGTFREDLYYRLLGMPIQLPSLRERSGDIIMLAKHFLIEFCKENSIKPIQLSAGATNKLMKYHYPGNIRELKALVELSAVMTNTNVIEEDNITFNSSSTDFNGISEELTMKEFTEKLILHYLKIYDDNVLLVAEKLDIGKSTIYNLLKTLKDKK